MTGNGSHPWWSRAITLAECASASPRESATQPAPRTAERPTRLDRWRRQRPFERPELLGRRLALNALSEQTFDDVLDARSAQSVPAWVNRLHDARRSLPHRPEAIRPAPRSRDAIGLDLARAFIEPVAVAALGRLFASATHIRAERPNAPFDPDRVTLLFEPSLWNQLVQRCFKVGILELNVARVQGRLSGESPQERYADFARQVRTTDLRDRILEEYPVLARALVTGSDYWEAAATEFLEHLATDAVALQDTFSAGTPLGHVTELEVGAGDVHRHGRSVMIVGFSSGTRVVYKPRSLAADVRFERLLHWINARGQMPALEGVRSLDCGRHGWAAFAARADCVSADAIERFYVRFGSYLAVLHALEATDFHYENVIAAGEHPMLIDLEALFHPRHGPAPQHDDPDWIGWDVLQRSVLRAGVLPFRVFGSEKSAGIDMSAVGGGRAQQTPNRFPTLVDAGTDVMRLERAFVTLPPSQNRPALGGEPVDPARYVDRIIAGFAATYRLLLRHRDELLAPDGPIERFADAPIRVVLRATRQYALMLSESYHPDVLRDALDRDLLFDRLWLSIPSRPELERVVVFEHADLVDGDVPLFTSRPDSRDLFTTHGTRIAGYFAQSGLDAALARIASLSDEDLERQQWVVRASLVALSPARHTAGERVRQGVSSAPNASSDRMPSSDECVAAAHRVAGRLSDLALRQRRRASWLGLTLAMDRDWVIQPVGTDVYGGTLGIAHFLARVASITGDAAHAALARDVIAQTVTRLSALAELPSSEGLLASGSIGGFGLLGGGIYVLTQVGALWGDAAVLDVAERIASRARDGIAPDPQLDVIAGSAGLALAVAALDAVRPGGVAREVIRQCADRLVDAAVEHGDGIAWHTRLEATQPLTGFSHGASGMAAALAVAGAVLGESRYSAAALSALRYERATFDASACNWPDYRILDAAPVPAPLGMWAWCHGAPGIGLARLIVLRHVEDADVRRDLDAALRSTVANGFGSNDSLCHGDLGNLDLLVQMREQGHTGEWERTLAREAARLVERLGRGEWRCGIPGGVETPGLMMGLAGIGYGLLRLGAPDRVASVLSLEAPRSGSSDHAGQ